MSLQEVSGIVSRSTENLNIQIFRPKGENLIEVFEKSQKRKLQMRNFHANKCNEYEMDVTEDHIAEILSGETEFLEDHNVMG